jgi:hypothetical protein
MSSFTSMLNTYAESQEENPTAEEEAIVLDDDIAEDGSISAQLPRVKTLPNPAFRIMAKLLSHEFIPVKTRLVLLTDRMNNLRRSLMKFPDLIHDKTISLSQEIAGKIHEYADKMSGRNEPSVIEFANVLRGHLAFIDDLRRKTPGTYRIYLLFIERYKSTPVFLQPKIMRRFFRLMADARENAVNQEAAEFDQAMVSIGKTMNL